MPSIAAKIILQLTDNLPRRIIPYRQDIQLFWHKLALFRLYAESALSTYIFISSSALFTISKDPINIPER